MAYGTFIPDEPFTYLPEVFQDMMVSLVSESNFMRNPCRAEGCYLYWVGSKCRSEMPHMPLWLFDSLSRY